jgi:fructokinase
VIAVAGEALVDMVVRPDGQIDARPGGGPYNTARTLARLGAETAFLDRLSSDAFGGLLRERLTEAGVTLAFPEPSDAPTTLALASVDRAGVPSFAFYLNGTSAADLRYEQLKAAVAALATPVSAVHIGTLGLVMEPIGTAIEQLIRDDVPAGALVMLDPNCRPGAVSDHRAYRERLFAIARRADIVKASIEDLAYLCPGKPAAVAAAELRATGPALVLLTDGPNPARAYLPGTVLTEEVPAVPVADTIGAGDALGGGFLAWWTAHGRGRDDLHRPELVKAALMAAVGVAALTCARPGADPPALAEVQARDWWPEAY